MKKLLLIPFLLGACISVSGQNAGTPFSMYVDINPAGVIWDNTMLYLTDHSGHGGGNKMVSDSNTLQKIACLLKNL